MLITSFEPQTSSIPREITFRGKNAYYWKQRILQLENSYKPGDGFDNVDNIADIIVVFEPRKFLVIPKSGVQEILDHLKRRDPGKKWIATLKGSPFYALSRPAAKAINLDLEAGENVLACCRNTDGIAVPVHTIESSAEYRVVDLYDDPLAVEDAVVRYQATKYVASGVLFDDYRNFYIEGMLPIGEGSRIGTGVYIKGESSVGKNCTLYPNVFIQNSKIGDNCTLLPGTVVGDSELEDQVQIGPYTHLRNGALVKKGAKMGNFVEMKKSVLGEGSKSMHLTYIGDSHIGKKVNIGAGTITCNYDGVNKNKTTIEDGVFIGSGTELVAPVTIKKNGYVAAGSTITEEVPEDSLGVARGRQRNIAGWVARKRNKTCKP